mgnify:CR=1 FL=1
MATAPSATCWQEGRPPLLHRVPAVRVLGLHDGRDATGSAAVSNLSSVVWNFADVMNALMAIPNCIAVLGLSAIIARETKHYVYDSTSSRLPS